MLETIKKVESFMGERSFIWISVTEDNGPIAYVEYKLDFSAVLISGESFRIIKNINIEIVSAEDAPVEGSAS